jgi:hypothetical protein
MMRLVCPREFFDSISQVIDMVNIAVCDFE